MRTWVFGAAVALVLLRFLSPREASAACVSALDATHFCVTHNGQHYLLDDGSGAVSQKILTVDPDVELTFELDPNTTIFHTHPFYITDSPFGGGAGTAYTTPAMSGTVTFTPTTDKTPLYYQCSVHTQMGARIDILGADAGTDAGAPPSELPDASTTSSSSSSTSSTSSTSSSTGGPTSSSSGSAAPTPDAGMTPSPSNAGDDGGCNTTGAGASGFGLLLAAAFVLLGSRFRRKP